MLLHLNVVQVLQLTQLSKGVCAQVEQNRHRFKILTSWPGCVHHYLRRVFIRYSGLKRITICHHLNSSEFSTLVKSLDLAEMLWIKGVPCDFTQVFKDVSLEVSEFRYTDVHQINGQLDLATLGMALPFVKVVDFSRVGRLTNADVRKFLQ